MGQEVEHVHKNHVMLAFYMAVYVLEKKHVNVPNAICPVYHQTNLLSAMQCLPANAMLHAWLAELKHVFEKTTLKSQKQ